MGQCAAIGPLPPPAPRPLTPGPSDSHEKKHLRRRVAQPDHDPPKCTCGWMRLDHEMSR